MRKPNIALGVPEMDEDHARLEGLFESVRDTPDSGLAALLAEAEAETRSHFDREEELMRQANLPILFCHVAQHQMILGELVKGRNALARGDWAGLRHFLGVELAELIESHVASVDRVTAAYLKGEIEDDELAPLKLPVTAKACG